MVIPGQTSGSPRGRPGRAKVLGSDADADADAPRGVTRPQGDDTNGGSGCS